MVLVHTPTGLIYGYIPQRSNPGYTRDYPGYTRESYGSSKNRSVIIGAGLARVCDGCAWTRAFI